MNVSLDLVKQVIQENNFELALSLLPQTDCSNEERIRLETWCKKSLVEQYSYLTEEAKRNGQNYSEIQKKYNILIEQIQTNVNLNTNTIQSPNQRESIFQKLLSIDIVQVLNIASLFPLCRIGGGITLGLSSIFIDPTSDVFKIVLLSIISIYVLSEAIINLYTMWRLNWLPLYKKIIGYILACSFWISPIILIILIIFYQYEKRSIIKQKIYGNN